MKHNPLKHNIPSLFYHYALPTILGMTASTSAVIIDGMFIGRYAGPNAMASITMVWPVLGICFGFFYMIVIGGSASMGTMTGAGKRKEASDLYTQLFILLILLSISMILLTNIFLPFLLNLLNIPELLWKDARVYLMISTFFFPFFALNLFFAYISRLAGHPRVFGLIMFFSALVNIALDALFIVYMDLAVTGAALGTGLSFLFALLIGLFYTLKGDFLFKFTLPRAPLSILFKSVYNGISELLTETSASIMTFFMNLILISIYGPYGVTSLIIINYITILGIMISYGFAEAAQPLISQNTGAGHFKRVKAFLSLSILSSVLSGILLAVVLTFFIRPFLNFFVSYEELEYSLIINLSIEMAALYWPALIFMGIGISFSSYFTAIENPGMSLIVSSSRIIILPGFFLVLLYHFAEAPAFILTFPLAEGTTAVLAWLLYLKKSPGNRHSDSTSIEVKSA